MTFIVEFYFLLDSALRLSFWKSVCCACRRLLVLNEHEKFEKARKNKYSSMNVFALMMMILRGKMKTMIMI